MERILLSLLVSAFSAVVITSFLKFVFGRSGPIYWLDHLDEINNYGYHLFIGYNQAFKDFPSGHSAAISAIYTVMVLSSRYHFLSLLAGVATIIGLILTNNHFLSDYLAGMLIGCFLGNLSAKYFDLKC